MGSRRASPSGTSIDCSASPDLEKLIDLADKGFRVISSHGARDLSDPDDRFILRIEVAHAARSSDDASRRIRRRLQDYRERGRSAGRPGFGFERTDRSTKMRDLPSDAVRPLVPGEQVLAEQVALRDAVADLLAGRATQVEIARRWNRAGLWTPDGNEWDSVTSGTRCRGRCSPVASSTRVSSSPESPVN